MDGARRHRAAASIRRVDNFFVPYGTGPFPIQGTGTALNGLGNETRYNPESAAISRT